MKKTVFLIFVLLMLPITAFPGEVTVIGVGDIMMGTDYPEKYFILPPDDGRDLFAHVEKTLGGADVVFGNLEGVLSDGGDPTKDIDRPNTWVFRTPTKYARNLKQAHFNVMSIRNNHAWDFGQTGMDSTMATLDALSIKHAGPRGDHAYFRMGDVSIGLVAFSTNDNGYNIHDLPGAAHLMAALRSLYDIVIVSFHGGTEGRDALHTLNEMEYLGHEPRGNVVRFAHTVIDGGADLVIGHGPHVPRALELYKGRLIAYSLGNFCTYGIISIKKESGIAPVLKVHLDGDGTFVRGKIFSFRQQYPGFPVPDPKHRAAALMKSLSETDFPANPIRIDAKGNISIN